MTDNSPNLKDSYVRFEIFSDWEECNGYLSRRGIDQFCYSKGITIEELICIVKEFERD